ncbi:MAG: hypothetical protein ACRDRL_16595 [Sciscionella sp.]
MIGSALEDAAGSADRTVSTSDHRYRDRYGLFLGLSSGPQA